MERLRAMIQRADAIASIGKQMQRITVWVNPSVGVIQFDDIVVVAGGGSDSSQRKSIRKLYDYLEMELDDSRVEFIESNCRSSKTQTFRNGKTRNREIHLHDKLKSLFKNVTGYLLVEMGYQSRENWCVP